MKFTEITVDVYGTRQGGIYRLYINDELLTERTFIWNPDEYYIEEHIIIQSDGRSFYTISVEGLRKTDGFLLKNVVVNGRKTETTFQA